MKTSPARLYKYRAFSTTSVDLLLSDHVYFANPSTFNDPLDTRPTVEPDLGVPDLEEILRRLVETRVLEEMKAAARTIRYKGPKTVDHINRHSRLQADRLLADIAYNAQNPEYEEDPPRPQLGLLAQHIEAELLRQYDKGIFSLAERYTCPLMWSHYGDQHNGLCIGYSIPPDAEAKLHKVHYGGSRLVNASQIMQMLNGDVQAKQDVDAAVLLRKAVDWQYEKEWRLIGTRGIDNSPLELEEIIFGIRCTPSVRHAVVKALAGRQRSVSFYEMHEDRGTFNLERCSLNEAELGNTFPIRALSALDGFEVTPED